jgi:hypothetical protein
VILLTWADENVSWLKKPELVKLRSMVEPVTFVALAALLMLIGAVLFSVGMRVTSFVLGWCRRHPGDVGALLLLAAACGGYYFYTSEDFPGSPIAVRDIQQGGGRVVLELYDRSGKPLTLPDDKERVLKEPWYDKNGRARHAGGTRAAAEEYLKSEYSQFFPPD